MLLNVEAENQMTKPLSGSENSKTDNELWITPEKSLFRTRMPRPHHVILHLVLAFVMFLLALAIAIFYSES